MKTKVLGGTAAALAVAGLAVLAPSAAHADPGAHVGAPLSVCGAEAGAQVTVIESVPARGSVTSVAEADAEGCATFDGVGTAQLSVTVISGSSAGYVSYAPSVSWDASTQTINWRDWSLTAGDIEAAPRVFEHVDALRESIPVSLTLTD